MVDFLGRGESDASPHARYDLDSEVRRLLLVLDSMDVSRPLLAGHSHGAAIAVAAARRANALGLLLVNPVTPDLPRPAALTALRSPAVQALVSPAVRLFRRPLTRYMLVRRVFADRGAIPAGLVARYADPWGDPGRAAGLPAILSDWSPAQLNHWDRPPGVPVHVIAGAQDRRVRPDSARRWADRLGATFELVAGCGHSAPEERTAEVAASLDDLLRTISKETGRDQDDQERPVDSTSGA
jgi:pimeloyl-ACP methyl ester carboxylesterase